MYLPLMIGKGKLGLAHGDDVPQSLPGGFSAGFPAGGKSKSSGSAASSGVTGAGVSAGFPGASARDAPYPSSSSTMSFDTAGTQTFGTATSFGSGTTTFPTSTEAFY